MNFKSYKNSNGNYITKAEQEQSNKRFLKKMKEYRRQKQQSIPTLAEVRREEKDWNSLYNEGGEGYTPHIISKEEYENAKKVLSHH